MNWTLCLDNFWASQAGLCELLYNARGDEMA